MKPLQIGTRGSALALWQAHDRGGTARAKHGVRAEIVVIKTGGDRLQDAPLSETGGKGLFVKEIEDALLAGDIDLAVHSAKDMSAVLPGRARRSRRSCRAKIRATRWCCRRARRGRFRGALAHIGEMPTIGTGSVRRIAQLAARSAAREVHCRFAATSIRGCESWTRGEYEALVLAAAGLRRLGLESRISAAIPLDVCVPAPGQGIVAIETRDDDRDTRERSRRSTMRRRRLARRRARRRDGARRRLPAAARRHRGARPDALDDAGDRRVARWPRARSAARSKGPAGDPAALGRAGWPRISLRAGASGRSSTVASG